MGCHSKGVVSSVEGDELGLEHDVTIDLEVAGGGLKTSEAGWKEYLLV